MFKKILVPVDPANLESASRSLELAKTLVDNEGQITILSVIEELPIYVVSQLPGDFEHKARLETQKSIQSLLDKQEVDAHVMLHSGHASGNIIQTQKSGEFDLVIIASHKPHNMDYLLGSTASRVVRKAECAVFITR